MNELLNKIESTIKKHNMIRPGDKVLVALSGGPDSVCLFHTLNLLSDRLKINLGAANLNYRLRPDADEEQRFCRQLCRFNRVPFHTQRIDARLLSKRRKQNLEEFCREYRYGFFSRISEKYGYTKIATGHTANDSAETLLFNLIRGADLGGLGGVSPANGMLIRPLIEISRAEVIAFLENSGLSYRIDKSNLDTIYSRNKIRHQVIPILLKINNSAIQNAAKAAQAIRQTHEFIELMADEILEQCAQRQYGQIWLDLNKLGQYHKKLVEWVLVKASQELSGEIYRPPRHLIELALNLKNCGSFVWLAPQVMAISYRGRLGLIRPAAPLKKRKITCGETICISGDGLKIRADIIRGNLRQHVIKKNDENIAILDAAKATGLRVRNLKTGDKFKPLNMKGSKKLADFLNDKGVPGPMKKYVPIVTAGNKIAWVAGFGIGDDFKITENTRQAIRLCLFWDKN